MSSRAYLVDTEGLGQRDSDKGPEEPAVPATHAAGISESATDVCAGLSESAAPVLGRPARDRSRGAASSSQSAGRERALFKLTEGGAAGPKWPARPARDRPLNPKQGAAEALALNTPLYLHRQRAGSA